MEIEKLEKIMYALLYGGSFLILLSVCMMYGIHFLNRREITYSPRYIKGLHHWIDIKTGEQFPIKE